MSIPSPCTQQCRLDAATQTCSGCRRTLDEIAAWSQLDDAGKAAVWQRLLALPMAPARKTCARCGAVFECGSGGRDGGCWCADLPPVHALPSSANEGGDCLCPACLEAGVLR
ncbi:Predicted Fe-S protein YdhL, DUF1289 family [Andreprevotia lacus DSM 23236]|jgi:predicted Fe-S protein YdhL (DUF1289 family)|uniref:Predicted Fe-S protein YdhL, DUF1289 family n=1 Tax=Andreprevotia lacus DSM 23236 TaxID=1121001 RepID=A0A1W1XWZ2_9NEIS|nr:cysteine-rich CWC family protein [Andreprevotia lacus]SMC28038.1 Predicted Fe-S protein YdhL, DUF1289 family [Andreprevotia lacus DSM 23236]